MFYGTPSYRSHLLSEVSPLMVVPLTTFILLSLLVSLTSFVLIIILSALVRVNLGVRITINKGVLDTARRRWHYAHACVMRGIAVRREQWR